MKTFIWILIVCAGFLNEAEGFTENACEGQVMRAWCSSSRDEWLIIDDVFFGRNSTTTCPHDTALTDDTQCIPDMASLLANVRQVCEGRKECKIHASWDALGDPCPGIFKYANVTYRCRPCEDVLSDCADRKSQGMCEDPSKREEMETGCFRTCSRCAEMQSGCDNIHDSTESLSVVNADCDYWALRGLCNTDPYVVVNCSESCKTCAAETRTSIQACEGENVEFGCETPYYLIDIEQVQYGRFDTSFCEHETAANGSDCTESEVAAERMRKACEGRSSCIAQVRNAALDPSDPCPDVAKQANITYKCRRCANVLPDSECRKEARLQKCEFNRDYMLENCFAECSGCTNSACENAYTSDVDCDFWAMQGECSSNPNWMPYLCEKSCRSCDCTNLAGDAVCKYWSDRGECSANPRWMRYENCVKACGSCDCENKFRDDVQCEAWAAAGECDRNPFWMLYECAHACYSCFEKIGEFKQGFCESSPRTLHCDNPGQKIRISDLFYGRRNNVTCPHVTYDPEVTCAAAEDTYAPVRDVCNGLEYCVINPNAGLFDDPCEGIVKQLEVSYFCQDCSNIAGDAQCATRKNDGECESDPETMLDDCFRACTGCVPGYECFNADGDDACDWWAMRNECVLNPNYMLTRCAKSCRQECDPA